MLTDNDSSYPGFTGSFDNKVRDQEFFAWINACFSARGEFMGTIETSTMQAGPFTAIPAAQYRGVIPQTLGQGDLDWSEDGVNWREQ